MMGEKYIAAMCNEVAEHLSNLIIETETFLDKAKRKDAQNCISAFWEIESQYKSLPQRVREDVSMYMGPLTAQMSEIIETKEFIPERYQYLERYGRALQKVALKEALLETIYCIVEEQK